MYINYGDKDFFNYGCLVDFEYSDTEIKILYCIPYDDEKNKYLFADCEVNTEDSWIDRNAIMNYLGMNENNFDVIQFAIGCVDYYGAENFSSPYNGYQFTKEEIKENLKHYLIANDNLDITW